MSHPLDETWLWVPGYEQRYEVSDHGRIRSWAPANGFTPRREPLVMTASRNYAGYRVVSLHDGTGGRCQRRLHCLVLEAFRGPRPLGHQGAHEDDDKDNNHLLNLRWKTIAENTRDRQRNGRIARGSEHGRYTHGKYVGRTRIYEPPKHI